MFFEFLPLARPATISIEIPLSSLQHWLQSVFDTIDSAHRIHSESIVEPTPYRFRTEIDSHFAILSRVMTVPDE